MAEHLDVTLGGYSSQAHLDRGRLAGPVRTQETEDFPRRTSKSTLSTARLGAPQKSLKTLVRPRTATTISRADVSREAGRLADSAVIMAGLFQLAFDLKRMPSPVPLPIRWERTGEGFGQSVAVSHQFRLDLASESGRLRGGLRLDSGFRPWSPGSSPTTLNGSSSRLAHEARAVEDHDQRATFCKIAATIGPRSRTPSGQAANDEPNAEHEFWLMTDRVMREGGRGTAAAKVIVHQRDGALWMATSLPAAPMAMPMSPAASIGASLTPSPTTATR